MKKLRYSAGPSKTSNVDGVTNRDPVQILVDELDALPIEHHVTRHITVFHVPSFRDNMRHLPDPQMVSIGPYHHGKESLRPLEKHKRWYLRDFLARKPEIGFEVYLREMREMEKNARQFYDDISEMSSDEFVLMLLLDGCFILECFLKYEVNAVDNVTDVGWRTLDTDFLLLENQIPYSVIHKLGSIYYGTLDHNCKDDCPVRTLVYKGLSFQDYLRPRRLQCGKIDHLLHLYLLRIVPSRFGRSYQTNDSNNDQSLSMKARCLSWLRSKLRLQPTETESRIPSATKLREAGVTFKEKINPRDLFDITFENGVMEIPCIGISSHDKVLFTNLLLYEQAQDGRIPTMFTSFLTLMDFLVDTSDDVAILVRAGILLNFLPNDEEVAVFFNQMCDYTWINIDESYYSDINNKIVKYINLPWNRYRAMLVRDYFSSPWTILSLIGAVLLLLLTVTQTGFSIYPVLHPN